MKKRRICFNVTLVLKWYLVNVRWNLKRKLTDLEAPSRCVDYDITMHERRHRSDRLSANLLIFWPNVKELLITILLL